MYAAHPVCARYTPLRAQHQPGYNTRRCKLYKWNARYGRAYRLLEHRHNALPWYNGHTVRFLEHQSLWLAFWRWNIHGRWICADLYQRPSLVREGPIDQFRSKPLLKNIRTFILSSLAQIFYRPFCHFSRHYIFSSLQCHVSLFKFNIDSNGIITAMKVCLRLQPIIARNLPDIWSKWITVNYSGCLKINPIEIICSMEYWYRCTQHNWTPPSTETYQYY